MKLETSFFGTPARILRGEKVIDAARDIARHPGQEDAFCVLDVGDIVQKIKGWKLKMPRVKPFYAVKCNDNLTVLQILSSLGLGFDCASKAEIKRVIEMGVTPSRIIYAHPCKPASHLRQAAALGVDLMTFDNDAELFKIRDLMPEAKLVIRIRCDATHAQCPLGEKFGVEPEHALGLLRVAHTLGLNVVGVSFHVGSGCKEPQVFLRAIKAAREVFDEAVECGFSPYLLDIGGGFPGDSGTSINEVAHYVNTALEQHFPDTSVEVIAEPGRYVVASAFTLVTQVIAKRRVEAPTPSPGGESESMIPSHGGESGSAPPSFMYYINDGVYGSFNCTLYDHQEVTPMTLDMAPNTEINGNRELFACSIWGPTCDSLDQVTTDSQLPEMDIGDWIIWKDMGAYTLAAAGTFNGFPVPLVHVVVPHHAWLFLEGILGSALLTNNPSAMEKIHEPGRDRPCLSSLLGRTPIPSFSSHFHKDQETESLDHLGTGFSRLSVVEM